MYIRRHPRRCRGGRAAVGPDKREAGVSAFKARKNTSQITSEYPNQEDSFLRYVFIEPRFLKEKQPQKPHNKLEKAQMMLRENKLNLELKLGGESDNPTSKGIP